MTLLVANDLQRLKLELQRLFDEPPQGPVSLWPTTSAALADYDPADYPYGVVWVTDINLGIMAVSNGTAWIRCDTGAAI